MSKDEQVVGHGRFDASTGDEKYETVKKAYNIALLSEDRIKHLEAQLAHKDGVIERLAEWIDSTAQERERADHPFPTIWDNACGECCYEGVVPGFKCTVHEARRILKEKAEQKAKEEARGNI